MITLTCVLLTLNDFAQDSAQQLLVLGMESCALWQEQNCCWLDAAMRLTEKEKIKKNSKSLAEIVREPARFWMFFVAQFEQQWQPEVGALWGTKPVSNFTFAANISKEFQNNCHSFSRQAIYWKLMVCISLVSAAPLENALGQEERQLGVKESVYGHWWLARHSNCQQLTFGDADVLGQLLGFHRLCSNLLEQFSEDLGFDVAQRT
jgi:hypothetical protein